MKNYLRYFLVAVLALNVSACGVKGRLKTPSQVEHEHEKKAKKQAEEAANPGSGTKDAPDTSDDKEE